VSAIAGIKCPAYPSPARKIEAFFESNKEMF